MEYEYIDFAMDKLGQECPGYDDTSSEEEDEDTTTLASSTSSFNPYHTSPATPVASAGLGKLKT